ncbi:MAG: hypothetical protein AAFU61_05740 [Pseudomonadota bacterium]
MRIAVFALVPVLAAALAGPAPAQEQQAGNAASTDTEGTFQALIDKCDDVDALMLRARIRLQLPRTTEAAAETAQKMLDDGFAQCGGGDLDGAKATLSEALEIATAGSEEVFAASEAAAAESEAAAQTAAAEAQEAEDADKPWWQFW